MPKSLAQRQQERLAALPRVVPIYHPSYRPPLQGTEPNLNNPGGTRRRRHLRRDLVDKEIQYYQDRRDDPILPAGPFMRIVKEILHKQTDRYRIERGAVGVLREISKKMLLQYFKLLKTTATDHSRMTIKQSNHKFLLGLKAILGADALTNVHDTAAYMLERDVLAVEDPDEHQLSKKELIQRMRERQAAHREAIAESERAQQA